MSLSNLSSLDFNDIRESIKSFLRSDGRFTDYDFEGSNFRILIDTLAYNTYISSYNANMLVNEVFLEGATLRENVVSIARNIGYLPRSIKSSKAKISFFVDLTDVQINPLALILKKGIIATTTESFSGKNYVYSIPDDIRSSVSNKLAEFRDIEIYEGTYLEDYFTVDSFNKNQRFILNNFNIDTETIRVVVKDSKFSNISRVYKFVNNITSVKTSDNVFFLNEIDDSRYELLFGDGTFGSKLLDQNYIIVSYIKTNGEVANGVSSFDFAGRLIDNNGSSIASNIPLLTTIEPSTSGSSIESISSIKKLAPRAYASQNRAVTTSDYEALLPIIYPETQSVSVFGGEDLNPPQYGKVFITLKPKNGSYLSASVKDELKLKLKSYAVAGIIPEFIDLKYLYIEYDSNIYYNSNKGYASNIKSIVDANILSYSKSDELNRYGSRFKYSKFLKLIDDSSNAITSNITNISIRRDLKVNINQISEYEICFGNEFHIKNSRGYNIKTSGMTIENISGTVYISDIPTSSTMGNLFIFRLDSSNNPIVVRDKVGTIDYKYGEIRINSLNIINTTKNDGSNNTLQISTIPKSNDVIGKQDLYLQLDTLKSSVNLITDTISSGISVSGSEYIVSSSYLNGDLIRI